MDLHSAKDNMTITPRTVVNATFLFNSVKFDNSKSEECIDNCACLRQYKKWKKND